MRHATRRWQRTINSTALLVAGIFLLQLSMPMKSVEAQGIPLGGGERRTLATIDFAVAEGITSNMGASAAAAMILSLLEGEVYQSISRAEVADAMKRLRLTRPIGNEELVALGRELRANHIMRGKVIKSRLSKRPRQAVIHLEMTIYDVDTGQPVNGANVIANSLGRKVSDSSLINGALNRAANKAVQQIRSNHAIEGQINIRQDNKIIFNRGKSVGVELGMKFSVRRRVFDVSTGEPHIRPVGIVEVTELMNQRSSEATIVSENVGMQTGDFVRSIYVLPELEASGKIRPPRPKKRKNVFAHIVAPLLAVGLIVGVVAMGKAGQGSPTGITAAQNSASGDPTILLNVGKGAGKVIATEIHRATSPGFNPGDGTLIDVVPGEHTIYYDRDIVYSGTATVEESGGSGASSVSPPTLLRTEEAAVTGDARRFTLNKGRYSVVQNYDSEFMHPPLGQEALPYGKSVWYVIRRVTARRMAPEGGSNSGGGGGALWEIVISDPSEPIGPVTPLRSMLDSDLISPPNEAQGYNAVDLSNVTFRFTTVKGADTYLIQVTDNLGFDQPNRIHQIVLPFYTGNRDGDLLSYTAVNELNAMFSSTQLFWRVGYRASRDRFAPQPDGYVMSPTHDFKTAEQPPGPSGS